MSNLVEHARRELEIIGEDKETTKGLLKVIKAFSDMGHSGGSAAVCIPRITALLNYENLTPLTDDPEEWMEISSYLLADTSKSLHQSIRNPAAFSEDGGKHYYLVSAHPSDERIIYESMHKE